MWIWRALWPRALIVLRCLKLWIPWRSTKHKSKYYYCCFISLIKQQNVIMVSMVCVIWELNVYEISVFCAMDPEVKFKVLVNQNFPQGKGVLFWNLWFTIPNGHYSFSKNSKTKERSRFAQFKPRGLCKGKDIGVDVQELTESIETLNAKILN